VSGFTPSLIKKWITDHCSSFVHVRSGAAIFKLALWWHFVCQHCMLPLKCLFLQEPHGVTSQKTSFFIVNAVKTSNLADTLHYLLPLLQQEGKGKNCRTAMNLITCCGLNLIMFFYLRMWEELCILQCRRHISL
jgi:hypothetical protein